MNEIVNQSAIDHLFLLFCAATALNLAWILETIWRKNKNWFIFLIFLPWLIIPLIFMNWEETRAKLFFLATLMVMILLIGGVVGYNFIGEIGVLLWKVALWPFFVYSYYFK